MQVDLGGAAALMAQPERDDRRIDTTSKERHGARVAQDVGRDPSAPQGRAALAGDIGVLGHEALYRVGAEPATGASGEEWVTGPTVALREPDAEHCDRRTGERGNPLLAPLADAAHVRPDPELEVSTGEPGKLGEAQAGLGRQQEECMIASAGRGGAVRRGEERLQFGTVEEGDEGALDALGRDGEHAPDECGVFGMTEGREAKERMDRGEADVAGAGAVAASLLEMLEEGAHAGGVEVRKGELRGCHPGALVHEGEQEPEGVAIGGDRMRAGIALTAEPVAKEGFEGRCECAHGRVSMARSRRSPARASNSGAACRYQ